MEIKAVWAEALPDVMKQVTGVGVWAAVRSAAPIAFEEGVLVLGLDSAENELAGHLRLAQPRRVIEDTMSRYLNQKVALRVIAGKSISDWETEKKRDVEKRKLQDQALQRQRAEIASGKSWDKVYEQLTRHYSEMTQRSLPQNRAKFFLQAVDVLAEALVDIPINDDLAERNYARCLERIAQYTELPSAFVAVKVLERTFGG